MGDLSFSLTLKSRIEEETKKKKKKKKNGKAFHVHELEE